MSVSPEMIGQSVHSSLGIECVILAGDPTTNLLIQLQSAGGHPGQLTPEELAKISEWTQAGAPEQ